MFPFVAALQQPQPAIAVPIAARADADLLAQVDAVAQSAAAVAEWRVDAQPAVSDKVAALVSARLHDAGKMLLVTVRTRQEGGAFAGSVAEYGDLNRRLLQAAAPDALDIEASVPKVTREALVQAAHAAGAAVVGSHHDFKQTPGFEAGRGILAAASLWADVVKLAAMPQTPTDTLALLALLAWAKATLRQPAIVIGMGALGQLTRVAGGAFAPGLTFATLGAASAPGQLSVAAIQALQEAEK